MSAREHGDGHTPIKVVNIVTRLNIGGPAVHVSLLTQQLGLPEFTSSLVAGQLAAGEGDMAYYATDHGVTPIMIPTLCREVAPLNDLMSVVALFRLLRRERPQIVHTHTAKAGFTGRIAARLARVPIIIHTVHGHVLEGYFGRLKSYCFLLLERGCARLTTRLLAVSEAIRQDLIAYRIAPAERIQTMELGLELDVWAQAGRRNGALRRHLGLGSNVPLLGFCGRLVAIKNPSLLLAAFERVQSVHRTAHLCLIGDGDLRASLEAEVAERGLRQVHFLGWQQSLPDLIADLDLLVLTSNNEGTPVAIIEAAAAGVPAVATQVGGVPDVIVDGETGWLVPPHDEQALAAALLEALTEPTELERRGQQAQERVLARFSVDRLRRDITQLYRELLGGDQ